MINGSRVPFKKSFKIYYACIVFYKKIPYLREVNFKDLTA